jgi:hypothetical protein
MHNVGGLIGSYQDCCHVFNCYATGSVTGVDIVGGLAGENIGDWKSESISMILRCFATGALSSANSGAAGLVASAGSLDSVKNCYWDKTTTGMDHGVNGISDFFVSGFATASMTKASTFSMLDFDSTWTIRTDSTYPGLQTLDNAPCAFSDSITIHGATCDIRDLLRNDCDIETGRNKLCLRVIDATNGTTDSVTYFTFPQIAAKGLQALLRYRIGEARTNDTLWGNVARSVIILDTTLPIAVNPASTPAIPKALGLTLASSHHSSAIKVFLALPSPSRVTVTVHDLVGREVATIIAHEQLAAGYHARYWNTDTTPHGVYLIRLQAGLKTIIRKMWSIDPH